MRVRIAVIVLTFDNFEDTVECLESVLRSHYPAFDVVLVDNHSTDGSIEKLRAQFPGVHHVQNDANLGVAGGRNAGWAYVREHVRADVLLFLDNDTVLEPGTIGALMAYLSRNPAAAILCGKAYTAPPSNTIMSAGMYINFYTGSIGDIGSGETDVGQYNDSGEVAACGGFCFLVTRAAFEACGGLDDDYNPYGWEDVDFCVRARQNGYQCHYVPDAVVYHKGCKIGRGYIPLYEKYKTKHYFRLLMRHTNAPQKACWGAVIAVRGAFILAKLVLRGEGRIAVAQLSGAYDMLVGRRPRARQAS
jgi:hypothetical protein